MAKSPIYGRGRNRSRNKGPVHAAAANINMRGKKSRADHCRCCICIDMCEDIQKKEHNKEINKYMKGEETYKVSSLLLLTFTKSCL